MRSAGRPQERGHVQPCHERAQRGEAVGPFEARAWEAPAPPVLPPRALLVGEVGEDGAQQEGEGRVGGCHGVCGVAREVLELAGQGQHAGEGEGVLVVRALGRGPRVADLQGAMERGSCGAT